MLNDKAREIFRYIVRTAREHGFPPTLREIGEEFRITSTNGVRYYLAVLEREGYVRRSVRISRGLEIPDSGLRRFSRLYGSLGDRMLDEGGSGIPILGRVAAGIPLLATENLEGTLELEGSFPSSAPRFALRVRGESMIDVGILPGDLVVVRQTETADDGDVVVALLGDEATVKTYRRVPEGIELQAANPMFQPILVKPGDDLRILGVVIGLVRGSSGISGLIHRGVWSEAKG